MWQGFWNSCRPRTSTRLKNVSPTTVFIITTVVRDTFSSRIFCPGGRWEIRIPKTLSQFEKVYYIFLYFFFQIWRFVSVAIFKPYLYAIIVWNFEKFFHSISQLGLVKVADKFFCLQKNKRRNWNFNQIYF